MWPCSVLQVASGKVREQRRGEGVKERRGGSEMNTDTGASAGARTGTESTTESKTQDRH